MEILASFFKNKHVKKLIKVIYLLTYIDCTRKSCTKRCQTRSSISARFTQIGKRFSISYGFRKNCVHQ